MIETASASINIDIDRVIGTRNSLIFGHFIEHFHRQIYGGIYEPGSPLSDSKGFRTDVVDALRKIKPPILRWPGGCFASCYHWKDGVGDRSPFFDMAWRVEDPNTFGTDEFTEFCRLIDTEPYICTNAGTGTPEEMAEWVEYCNLEGRSKWARLRQANGDKAPHNVRYWGIGNENYGEWEIGAKNPEEWGEYVLESAKMMRRVDPSIQILAAVNFLDFERIKCLLNTAGDFIDWISIHCYWAQTETPYESCVARSGVTDDILTRMEQYIGTLGFKGRIKIAFDEWNLRFWHHPKFHDSPPVAVDHSVFNINDDNSTYTMADAIFTARFLNACLRHCNSVQMANFSPVVNTRGAIFTHDGGIVKRSTYHVFDLYVNDTHGKIIDAFVKTPTFPIREDGLDFDIHIPYIDGLVTQCEDNNRLSIAISNLHREEQIEVDINLFNANCKSKGLLKTISGESADSYNDIDHPDDISITSRGITITPDSNSINLPPHSVSVLIIDLE